MYVCMYVFMLFYACIQYILNIQCCVLLANIPHLWYNCRPEPDTTPLISEVEFFHFALDIARALEFLASQMYVHRDIAARNCLGELAPFTSSAHA